MALRGTDRRVAAVIEQSAVFAVLARVLDAVSRAAAGSVVAASAIRAAANWRVMGPRQQRLAAGTFLLVAVAVHLALMLMTGAPPGWLWLVVPGMAGAIGLLLIVASDFPGVTRS